MTLGTDFLPDAQRDAMRRAVRLEYWNIGWTLSIVLVMGLVMGQSQTMKTAWTEDTLGLIPPIAILIALHAERRWPVSSSFPFGFHRVNGLGFFLAAVALTAVGALLLWDSGATLLAREHATVGSLRLFGRDVWLGWWWADAAAAALISLDILHDGVTALRAATAELVDGAPRGLGGCDVSAEADAIHDRLDARFPNTVVRVRETGRLIRAEVIGASPPDQPVDLDALWPGKPEDAWRLAQLSFTPAGASALAPREEQRRP